MNAPKVTDVDYIQFLIAAQGVYTCTEAARCAVNASHDAYTRLLSRLPPDTAALWQEVAPLVQETHGLLVVDDTTLDKPYAQKMGLVSRHWSGKHHAVVEGISLTTLLWTDGLSSLPCDCRLYEPAAEGQTQVTKNDHFLAMLQTAKGRGFRPKYVCFDSWYSSLANLKAVRGHGWHFLTRLKSNRQVDPDNAGNKAVADVDIAVAERFEQGRKVHLKGFGFVQVFRTVAPNGDVEHWATDDLTMQEIDRRDLSRQVFAIENYHRQLKQCCGVERAQVRSAQAQKCHIVLSLRAFVRLEAHRLQTGISGYAAKAGLIREAIRLYLRQPTITLEATA
jgi:putative transposase